MAGRPSGDYKVKVVARKEPNLFITSVLFFELMSLFSTEEKLSPKGSSPTIPIVIVGEDE